jgi:TRAP-type C4-dicarboxylate transport system permease small subunit
MDRKTASFVSFILAIGIPCIVNETALAATGSVVQVQSFIESIIKIIAGLAGLVATGFFVIGGLRYITSSGDPRHLDQAKRTILYSAIGLSITIAAFVISNIVTTLATNAFGS